MRVTAKKSLGQNFLSNPGIRDSILEAAELRPEDTVLEIGPGTGALTAQLAERAGRVIAVEKDRRLIPELRELFASSPHIQIIEGDILEFSPAQHDLTAGSYKIIGNIPYYLTSRLLRIMLERWPQPALIVLMVQKEVAERIIAKPPHMNLLALSVCFFAQPSLVKVVKRGSFRPIPEVDSAIIKLAPRTPEISAKQQKEFFQLIRAGFQSKRKQLASTLARFLKSDRESLVRTLTRLDIPPTARPENLSLQEWRVLIAALETEFRTNSSRS